MEALDPAALRHELVDRLRNKRLFANESVAVAFETIPRHLFLPQVDPGLAYRDQAIPLKTGSAGETLSSATQPAMMAIMLSQLDLRPGHNALEIGAASGYNAALIQHIVGDEGRVTSLEIDRDLVDGAQKSLFRAGISQVLLVNRDGVSGFEPRAQYDRIVATAGVWDVPAQWLRQLRDAGKLVVPIWLDGVQVSAVFRKQADGSWISRDNHPCAFVYLQGLAAGPLVRKRVGGASLEVLADEVDKIDSAALHLLMSDEREIQRLGANLSAEDFWHGLQLYVMLHEPDGFVFAVYAIPDGETAYGMQGNGILLFTPTSVAVAPYDAGGAVHSFGSSDAFMMLRALMTEWLALERRLIDRLALRLIPKLQGGPAIDKGKLFSRKDHFLHVWLD